MLDGGIGYSYGTWSEEFSLELWNLRELTNLVNMLEKLEGKLLYVEQRTAIQLLW